MKPPARGAVVWARWVTYNAGHASDDRLVADLARLAAMHPEVIALQEVGDRAKALARTVAQTGYRLVQLDRGPSSTHVALLVAPGVRMERTGIRRISPRTYVGRNTAGARRSGRAEAKWLLRVRYTSHDGQRWTVGVTHFVPSAGRRGNLLTRRLLARQVRAAAWWLRTRVRPAVVMGDLNDEGTRLGALRSVARGYTAPSHGRRSIDWIWLNRRAQAAVRVDRAEALDHYSSDHRPVALYVKETWT